MRFFKPFEPPAAPVFPEKYYNICDFGAVEGGHVKATEAIASAIRTCSEEGGGHVVFPKGTFLSGAIHLKDNVDLHFEDGCTLHFSEDFADYLPPVYGILAGIRCYSASHFLYAYRCRNIAVTGSGVLDGHGYVFWPMKQNCPGMKDLIRKGQALAPLSERVYDKPENGVRPRMLQFVECENILIEGVTFRNSPSWTVHPAWCTNLIIRGVVIRNPVDSPNTDGVNLESCRRALVDGIDVETSDDVCCLKAGRDRDARKVGIPCEDIEIRNCRSTRGHGGVTIGSETSAGIRNAYIHDCIFGGEVYSAVRIKTMKGRGGYIRDLAFENITAENASDAALFVTMRYGGEPLDDHDGPDVFLPEVENIAIKGFRCKNAKCPICLVGVPGHEIKNLYIEDVEIASREPMTAENTAGLHMKNVTLKTAHGEK